MRISQCEYCGEDLGGVVDKYPGDPMVTCGAAECDRVARDDERAALNEARYRTEEDNYGYYR